MQLANLTQDVTKAQLFTQKGNIGALDALQPIAILMLRGRFHTVFFTETGMETKTCNACGRTFPLRPQNPNQTYCTDPECQRERRRRWQQQKRHDDADYRDNDLRAAKAWATENPEYWKQYRDENPAYAKRNRNLQQQRNQKLRTSVIANEDASRPRNPLPAGRYRMVKITEDGASGDAWIVEIAVLTAIPADEDV